MIRVFDFVCPDGHKIERFVRDDVREHNCDCGKVSRRVIAAPRAKLDPLSGDFPGASMAWERTREGQMAKERRHLENHGTEWIGQSKSDDE